MYVLSYRIVGNGEIRYLAIPDQMGVFDVCWIFSSSNNIIEYRITIGSTILMPKDFRFGELNKWVEEFDWKKEK